MELYYRRAESVRKGRTVPARTQTVVIFLPDVRSCLPTRVEWDELNLKYKQFLEHKRKSNDDSKNSGDGEKKQTPAKPDESTHNENVADVDEMTVVDEVNDSEKETTNSGGDNVECPETADSADAKAATDAETTLATGTAAISKALLNIISNFTRDILFPFKCFNNIFR